MARGYAPLNAVQLEVLRWVRDGCSPDVYEDWSHRIVARALHSRGLIVVRGHGATWSAALTEDGTYYLEHGSYRMDAPRATSDRSATTEDAVITSKGQARSSPEAKPDAVQPNERKRARSTKSPRVQRPRPLDEFMATLSNAPDGRIFVSHEEEPRYRQLAGAARRFGRIPEGMQLSFGRTTVEGSRKVSVTLEPLPAWMTAVLDPIHVPPALQDPTGVVQDLMEDESFVVVGEARRRTLRLLDALVRAAEGSDFAVRAENRTTRRNSYPSGTEHARDKVTFQIKQDVFALVFTQGTVEVPHEPTPREVARARRGIIFPDVDRMPDTRIGIRMDGPGPTFWAGSWQDTADHGLEDDLAQILEEMRLRHEALVAMRDAEAARFQERQERWGVVRDQAIVRYRAHFVEEAMRSQAARWTRANELRQYAQAVSQYGQRVSGEEREQAIAWAKQISEHAAEINPLPTDAHPPHVPDPSHTDLAPFMNGLSPYGPS